MAWLSYFLLLICSLPIALATTTASTSATTATSTAASTSASTTAPQTETSTAGSTQTSSTVNATSINANDFTTTAKASSDKARFNILLNVLTIGLILFIAKS